MKLDLLKLDNENLDKLVKIAGTKNDRRIKLNDDIIGKAKEMSKQGKSYAEISRELNCSVSAVRYHVIPGEKEKKNQLRKNYPHYSTRIDSKQTGAYKRQLIKENKLERYADYVN